jgi:PAS domain S-box-containing protein
VDIESPTEILDFAPSAFVSMDEDGLITYWNIRAEQMFGLSREEAVGRVLADTIIPERDRAAHRHGLRRYIETGHARLLNRRVEVDAVRPGGEEFPVEMTISALKQGDKRSFHAFLLDISDRRAVERDREQRLEDLLGALRGSEQRFAVIVNALADAVTIRGTDNRLLYANTAALERLGLESVEQLRAADPQALMDPYETLGEDGRPIALEDLPSVRVLRGETPEPLTLRSVNRRTGEEQWALLKAAAVHDAAGRIEAAVTIIEDVTAAKRAALRSELLVRAASILASSLDYQQTIRNVAGLAVPQVADWCAVDLFDEDGVREPVAVAHVDPDKLRMAERLRQYEPARPDASHPLGRVWKSGEPRLYPQITEDMLVAFAVDDAHLALLREVGMCSGLIVPMRLSGSTIGALTLVSSESKRVFDRVDVEFAQQIADRAALAVDNSRQYRRRVEVARTLQSSLLPEALPEIPGWEIAAFYKPAAAESEVGGDFYDFWPVGDRWLMMIGDVTGKGVSAAVVTSLVRHTAWAASDFDPDPSSVLKRIDVALKRRPGLPLCTALCLSIDGEECTVACGGHPPLLHVKEDGVGEVGVPGTLLGAFANVDWPHATVRLQPGEILVAITDGVTDAVGRDGERFGHERLRQILLGARGEPPGAIRGLLLDELEGFQIGAQADDTAVVVMRYAGVPVGRAHPPNRNGASMGIGQR